MQAFTVVRNVFAATAGGAVQTNFGAIFNADVRGYLLSMTVTPDNQPVAATNRVIISLGTGAGVTRQIADIICEQSWAQPYIFDYKDGHGARGILLGTTETNLWVSSSSGIAAINVSVTVTVRPP
jgi:hypothetical protein